MGDSHDIPQKNYKKLLNGCLSLVFSIIFIINKVGRKRKKNCYFLKAMNSGVPNNQRYNLDAYNTRPRDVNVNVNGGFRMNGITWLIILLLVVGFILFLFKPAMVTSVNQNTGEVQLDWTKLIIWTILIALLILVILWVTRGIHGLISQ